MARSSASYSCSDKIVTFKTAHSGKSLPLDSSTPRDLAIIMLRELAVEGRPSARGWQIFGLEQDRIAAGITSRSRRLRKCADGVPFPPRAEGAPQAITLNSTIKCQPNCSWQGAKAVRSDSVIVASPRRRKRSASRLRIFPPSTLLAPTCRLGTNVSTATASIGCTRAAIIRCVAPGDTALRINRASQGFAALGGSIMLFTPSTLSLKRCPTRFRV